MLRTSAERFGLLPTSSTLRRSRGNTSRWTCGAMVAAEIRSARILAIGSMIGSLTIRVLPMYGGAFGRTGCTSATPKRSRSISSPRRWDRLDRMRNMRSTCTSHTSNGRHRPGLGVGANTRGRKKMSEREQEAHQGYAQCWRRTSENPISRHFGEYEPSAEYYVLRAHMGRNEGASRETKGGV